jgi:hypothetical protein
MGGIKQYGRGSGLVKAGIRARKKKVNKARRLGKT